MKTFKQHIHEKWIKSFDTEEYWGVIDIYENPTLHEIKILPAGVRGFLTPSGKVFVGSNGIHQSIAEAIKNEKGANLTTSIPFIIENMNQKQKQVRLGDFITMWYNKQDKAAEVIRKSRWFNRVIRDFNVVDNFSEPLMEGFFNGKKMKQLSADIQHQAVKMDNGKSILQKVKQHFKKDYEAYVEPDLRDYTKGMNKDSEGLVRLILSYFKESAMLGKYIDIERVYKHLLPVVQHRKKWA